MDPFDQTHEMFCADTRRENTPCDGASCRVGIALRAVYRAGLKRAVEIVDDLRQREDNLLTNTDFSAGSVNTLHGYCRALDALRAELGDDDE